MNAAYNGTKDAAKHTYDDAAHKAEQTKQSWGSWLGSWFGYGSSKAKETAEDAKSKTAARVAEGAEKVEKEAQKRA